jgi:hypothetical protein
MASKNIGREGGGGRGGRVAGKGLGTFSRRRLSDICSMPELVGAGVIQHEGLDG